MLILACVRYPQAPPFLAYYGVLSANTSLIQEAYDQIRLYRSYLQPNGTGLWSHILLSSTPDYGQWMTGNAWAAAGSGGEETLVMTCVKLGGEVGEGRGVPGQVARVGDR